MFYNIILACFFLPKALYQRIFFRKYAKTIIWRLGLEKISFSVPKEKTVIWIHAVSLGESKSGLIFLEKLKKNYPSIFVVYSTVTQTGMKAIKQSKDINLAIYLPLDFSWAMRKLMRKIQPHFTFLVETDIWPNFLKNAKQFGRVFLISAKLSKRSFKRLAFCPFFTKKMFSYFDHICVQNADIYERFLQLQIPKNKVSITGNLKYDQKQQWIDHNFWREKFNIVDEDFVITIASTHESEEILILDQLKSLFSNLKILLAPRHPERFEHVRKVIQRYSTNKILLIDKMGMLPACFQLSHVAIVGGSFVKGIGGHNVLEPCMYHVPVLFGPNMETQRDLVSIVQKYRLGWQIHLHEILSKVKLLMDKPYKQNLSFQKEIQGSSQKTLDILQPYLRESL